MADKNQHVDFKEDKDHSTKSLQGAEKPILQQDPVELARQYGLGFGVDGSSRTPWKSRSTLAYQVRNISKSPENVSDIQGSQLLNSYSSEVSPTYAIQRSLSAAVPLSKPVTIGVDCELHRSHGEIKRLIGKREIERRISFVGDVDERVVAESLAKDGKESFEQKLAKWLLVKMDEKVESHLQPIEALENIMATPEICSKVEQHYQRLVHSTPITHYVSSVLFGTCVYQVMTNEEYTTRVGTDVNTGIEVAADSVLHSGSDFHQIPDGAFSKVKKELKRNAGKISVIEVELMPVSSLIRSTILRKVVERVLTDYISKEYHYCIACTHPDSTVAKQLFFQVNDTKLEVTTNPEEASVFAIVPAHESKHPFDFNITYRAANDSQIRYLYVSIDRAGINDTDVEFKDNKMSRLSIHSRSPKSRTFEPIDPDEWIAGNDEFYINRRYKHMLRHDSYLCVTKHKFRPVGAGNEYRIACVPSVSEHDGNSAIMLFKLVQPWKSQPDAKDEHTRFVSSSPSSYKVIITKDRLEKQLKSKEEEIEELQGQLARYKSDITVKKDLQRQLEDQKVEKQKRIVDLERLLKQSQVETKAKEEEMLKVMMNKETDLRRSYESEVSELKNEKEKLRSNLLVALKGKKLQEEELEKQVVELKKQLQAQANDFDRRLQQGLKFGDVILVLCVVLGVVAVVLAFWYM